MSFGLSRGDNDLLFCRVDWHSVAEQQRNSLFKEIDAYNGDQLLNTALDDLVAYFVRKYEIDVPVLHEDQIAADQRETQIDVSQDRNRYILDRSGPFYVTGTIVEVEVPFSGDGQIFKVQPTTFTLNPPRAEIHPGKVILRIQGTNLDGPSVKRRIEETLSEIQTNLDRLRVSAEEFNGSLLRLATERIEARKKKLLADRNLVSGLGFALKSREGAARTYAAPEIRRKIVPVPPKASSGPYRPEPVMSDADYENILSLLEGMVRVMECSPHDFSNMGEETLRSHFLVQLNAQYVGQATGETFNYEGKTDILVKSDGRNIFVGECKFWKGQKKYLETIDQLLSYLSWRDTKAAVVVFNRNKDFSKVLGEIEAATPAHSNCKKLLRKRSETSWVYRFSHRDDPNREMTITIMAFDVPSADGEP